MKKQLLITIILVLVVGAGAFFGGMKFQKGKDSLAGLSGQELTKKMQSLGMSGNVFGAGRNININGAPSGDFPGGRQFGGGGAVNGEIVSMDSQSITVKDQSGNTKTVYYSTSTTISKTTTGSSSDLSVGTQVSANGTSNSDGSVTAQTIRISPAGQDVDTLPAI
jgi:hypothetical protein